MFRASAPVRILLPVLPLGATPALARAELAHYQLDPEHKTVAFLIGHMGYAKTLGLFRDVFGTYTFDSASGRVSDIRVVVNTASVDTAHAKRDEHVRAEGFLDVERYPQMVFSTTA